MANLNPNTNGLKMWKKGESGNPKGRLPDLAKTILQAIEEEKGLHGIVKAVWKQAEKGDVRAAEFIFDRLYGKPKHHTHIATEIKNPIFTGINLDLSEETVQTGVKTSPLASPE